MWVRSIVGVLGFCVAGICGSIAPVIKSEAIDLVDLTPDADLWEYRYLVSDYVFRANEGFTIYFDWQYFTGLEDPPPYVNSSWDVIVFPPDPYLEADGAYDALALTDGASLRDAFVVSFVYAGTTPPGTQRFDVNQFDSQGRFLRLVISGQTTAQIPEPRTALFILTGVALLTGFGARRRLRSL